MMKIKNPCIPCVSRQFVDLAERLTKDEKQQEKIIQYGLNTLSSVGFKSTAPYVVGKLYEFATNLTGVKDPYKKEKKEFNHIAEEMVEKYQLKDLVAQSDQALETSVRLSIAGNIIDFGLGIEIKADHVAASIEDSLEAPLFANDLTALESDLKKVSRVVVIGDNAGEIVFDKLLVKALGKKVTYVVKGGPIVNDATYQDAIDVQMNDLADIVDTGCQYQGIVWDESSETFIAVMKNAEMIISKGQANYECLNTYDHEKLYFLLRAKCPAVADMIGCQVNDFVCMKQKR